MRISLLLTVDRHLRGKLPPFVLRRLRSLSLLSYQREGVLRMRVTHGHIIFLLEGLRQHDQEVLID